ncbi:DUF805 domain-containing protein [Caballeronia sp. AZ10_KS36]|uniref:DUF805 domain-containing protein n=1 Tax=Caballeronia sp. AZ10_KS36 TaxID=2921757 RepID=UPI0020288C8C|nr:DUF805 domain-containing protein [Caballeronia sp. AZ10_KS36]
MGFFEAVRVSLIEKFATFAGRARRAEYWYFQLFMFFVGIGAGVLAEMAKNAAVGILIGLVVVLIMVIPGLAVTVRRLHDTDRSGWFYFIGCIPVIGSILLLVWICSRGTQGVNRYGSDPLGNS